MKPMWGGMGLLGVGLGLLWVATCVEATGESFGYEGRSGEHCVCKCTPKPSPPPHAPSLSPPPSSPPPPPKPKKHAYPPPPSPTLPPPSPPPPTYTPPPSPYLPPTPHLSPPPPSPITKPKPPPPQTCSSANLAKIQVCSPLLGLGGLNLGVVIGGGVSPAQKSQCCALLDLLGLDAEVCLCAAIDLNALGLVGVHAKIDLVVKVFTDCGRTAPPKLKACP